MTLNSCFSCPCLESAGIIGLGHCTQLMFYFIQCCMICIFIARIHSKVLSPSLLPLPCMLSCDQMHIEARGCPQVSFPRGHPLILLRQGLTSLELAK